MNNIDIRNEFEALKAMASLDSDLNNYLNSYIDQGRFFFKSYMKRNKDMVTTENANLISDKISLMILFRCYKRMALMEKQKADEMKKLRPELKRILRQIFN